jgi:hypothetical protein
MKQAKSLMRLAIWAVQEPSDRKTAESWVHFCLEAANEAYATVMENPPFITRENSAYEWLEELKRREKGEQERDIERERASGDELKQEAHGAATIAFRACMPHVTGRRNAQAYIACVAAGVQRRYITGADARALLYTAQLALSAARPSRAR